MKALHDFNASSALMNVLCISAMDFMDLSDRIQAATGIDIGVELMRDADKDRHAVVPRPALLCDSGLDLSISHGPATY